MASRESFLSPDDGVLPVAIVGGGPVGLALAHGLHARGIACRIFERTTTPRGDSRSIGIHPVSLEVLSALGLAEPLIASGLPIHRGHALRRLDERLGSLDFGDLPPPFPFVLAIPQDRTEAVFEEALHREDARILQRGVEVVGVKTRGDVVCLHCLRGTQPEDVDAGLVVACDGLRSTVRDALEIPFDGGAYPDRFAMGDFDDDTDLGPEAAIFLHPAGLIESFPLPGGLRRWVVRTAMSTSDEFPDLATSTPHEGGTSIRHEVASIVRERVRHDLRAASCVMESRFGVKHHLARRFVQDRVILAGDAAHVVSPIGGQGMNLGFLDVGRLLVAIDAIAMGAPRKLALDSYARRSRQVARAATRRAAFYMRLGRPRRFPWARDMAIRLLLATPPLAFHAARIFTMRGLPDVGSVF